MALQAGNIRLSGTIGHVTRYKMGDTFFARWKTRIDSRMFWKDKRFAGSRLSCRRFAQGNKLASQVYRSLPKEKRIYELFCKLKSAAILCLKECYTNEDTLQYLQQIASTSHILRTNKVRVKKPRKRFPYAIEVTTEYIHLTAGRWLQLQRTIPKEILDEKIESVLRSTPFNTPPTDIRSLRRCA